MEWQWIYKPVPNETSVNQLAEAINVNPALATLLAQRGITTYDTAKAFFRPSLDRLPDPFGMADLHKAVDRLVSAVSNEEKILFYGDYDVDGTTSVALMMSFFQEYYPQILYYIPDRYAEGYGLSLAGVDYARKEGVKLLITLDCGIKAHEPIAQANAWGMDVMVCDHHRPEGELPPAHAVLNPQRPDCPYPSTELSGCGVGFKLLQGFCLQQGLDLNEHLYPLLDLVTIAIAADIVPIKNENRILAHYGLQAMNVQMRPGVKARVELAGMSTPISISDVVFYLAPRINAAGRLAHAHDAVKLFLSTKTEEAQRRAQALHDKNQERKQVDQSITQEALAMLAQQEERNSTVLFKDDWHKGIIGIVASRCIEHHYRPTIILTESNRKATGSARSVAGFDIYEALHECADLLDQFGGHTYAAGMTLPLENVPKLQARFEEVVANTITPEAQTPQLEIDLELPLAFITDKFYRILKQMAPFGPANPEPILVSHNLTLGSAPRLLKEKHLKMSVTTADPQVGHLEAIGFNMAEYFPLLKTGDPFSMAYTLQENTWRGETSLQLRIKDIRIESLS
ncbi:MAG TPA: single-stranded-DNA-specific exonuclease RecJ [Cytophagales bacterium]|nr:single-stranded-DNA-specific exonuclease RecJ [Cytophagales bacterium]